MAVPDLGERLIEGMEAFLTAWCSKNLPILERRTDELEKRVAEMEGKLGQIAESIAVRAAKA